MHPICSVLFLQSQGRANALIISLQGKGDQTVLTSSLLLHGHGEAEADEAPEGEGGPADDGHPLQPVLLHALGHHGLQVLRLPVARLHLQQRPHVLERRLVLLDARVPDGQVVQIVSLAALVAVLGRWKINEYCIS